MLRKISIRDASMSATERRDDGHAVAARSIFTLMGSDLDRPAILSSDTRLLNDEDASKMSALLDEINDIAGLADGWYDGEGKAPHPHAIRGARRLAPSFVFSGLPQPHAFPVPDGGVMLEWELPDISASIEFEISADTATVSSLNIRTDRSSYEEDVEITYQYVSEWLTRLQAAD